MSIQGRKYTYYVDEVQGNNVTTATYGTAVRKIQPAPRRVTTAPKKKSAWHLKNWDRKRYMNLPYVMFLAGLLMICGLTLMNYLSLQSEITTSIKSIARMERELNNLRLANDENHSRITNNIDLDHIRRVAIQELGMIYPREGQIVSFAGNNSDYVRQLNPMP